MLKVKTELRPSTIPGAGIGLFAAELILKGTVVDEWQSFFDRVITQEEYATYDAVAKKFVDTYSYRREEDGIYYIHLDNGRFMNHSEDPNVGSVEEYGPDIAFKDILPGEELLCDYRLFATEFKGY